VLVVLDAPFVALVLAPVLTLDVDIIVLFPFTTAVVTPVVIALVVAVVESVEEAAAEEVLETAGVEAGTLESTVNCSE